MGNQRMTWEEPSCVTLCKIIVTTCAWNERGKGGNGNACRNKEKCQLICRQITSQFSNSKKGSRFQTLTASPWLNELSLMKHLLSPCYVQGVTPQTDFSIDIGNYSGLVNICISMKYPPGRPRAAHTGSCDLQPKPLWRVGEGKESWRQLVWQWWLDCWLIHMTNSVRKVEN